MQLVSLEHWYLSYELHDVTLQKTVIALQENLEFLILKGPIKKM